MYSGLKTPDFSQLCLRSIHGFTEYPYEVIVVDNDSQDESLEYLKSLDWIQLIERRPGADEPGGCFAHATKVVNPQEFTLRKSTIRKCHRLVDKVMLSTMVQSILVDDSLD